MSNVSGVCRVCGCTDSSPCVISSEFTLDNNPHLIATCSWLDPAHTICSNLDCVAVIPLDELIEIIFRAEKARAVAR
jgi:hypothetical protein